MRPLALAEVRTWKPVRSLTLPGKKGTSKGAEIAKGSVPIHFDPKSHTFIVPHEQVRTAARPRPSSRR